MSVDEYLSPQEVADTYKISVQTVYQWRWRGIGPRGAKIGKHVRYRRRDVEKWFDEQLDRDPSSIASA